MRVVSSGSAGFAVLRREANECGFFRPIVKEVVEMLRIFFKNKRGLLGDLCRCGLRALTRYFEVVTGSALTPGVIAAIQTFGDRINLHVHLHFLATEGGVNEAGVFHKIPRIDDSRLAEIFAREVLAMLVRKELLSPEWAERILSWPHSGFNVHSHIFIARVTSHCSRQKSSDGPFLRLMRTPTFIDHLKLGFVADRPPPSPVFEQVALPAAEESGEYFYRPNMLFGLDCRIFR
jgi:hypothetical protein